MKMHSFPVLLTIHVSTEFLISPGVHLWTEFAGIAPANAFRHHGHHAAATHALSDHHTGRLKALALPDCGKT